LRLSRESLGFFLGRFGDVLGGALGDEELLAQFHQPLFTGHGLSRRPAGAFPGSEHRCTFALCH
jgi:hypothetical protein